ncbi:hypothetical protein [Loktanella sp. Alg231-35]|uniref:hypothetical protein n=1 Tax=Loktanella sp. Alg231-35 TaxID=1922220 RepID=UPI000D54F536|nr:hypothetical protein [Loktanella sp. Alg231-35]
MSDLAELAQKISALAAKDTVFETGARVISTGGEPSPIVAILNEIDDTILERDLEIQADGAIVNLIVSGRRLRGIAAASSGADDVVGHVLSREEPDMVAAAFVLLSELCGRAQRLTVRYLAPQPFGKGGERGISAKGLAALWKIDLDEVPKPPMERFLSTNRSAAIAMIHMTDGEMQSSAGDVTALQSILDTQLADFRGLQTLGGGAQLICLEGALSDGSAAALAIHEDDVALIAYQPDHLGALHASWRAILG